MKKVLSLLLLATFLVACGQGDDSSNGSSEKDVVKPIDVQLDAPEKVAVNEATTFSVTVTQGDEAVKDASEVEFEIWQDGLKDESEMIKAKNDGNGIYLVEKTFTEDGIYFVQSHVTARGMHTMPKAEVVVGSPNKSNTIEEAPAEDSKHSHSHSAIQFHQPDQLTAGEEATFTVEVNHDDQQLEGANISLEIYQKGDEKHDWINGNEIDPGTYVSKVTFDKNGKYTINVHVEKKAEEIHDHKEYTVEIK